MNDILGREIKVGDTVVLTPQYSRKLCLGVVTELCPKRVKVKYLESVSKTGKEYYCFHHPKPEDVCVVYDK